MTGLDLPVQASLRRLLKERADEWLQRFYRHEILVARTVRGMQVEAVEEFNRTVVNPLLKEVAGRLATMRRPTSPDLVQQLFPELAALRREIEQVVAQGSDAVRRLTERRLLDIAEAEARWVASSVKATTGQTMPAQVQADALNRPWLGDSTEDWFKKLLDRPTADAARAWVTTGIQQGLTVDEITRGLRGTRTQTGILERGEQAAAALVRTAATHASAVARADSYKALGVTHWRFVATLDSRTSVQCAANDGKVYRVGEGPMPPLHPNCRSTTIPDFGDEPAGTRASIDGQVPASKSFEDWLETRPRAEQDEVLGKAKAAAWRSGNLSLQDMLGRDMEPLTLAELRDLDRM